VKIDKVRIVGFKSFADPTEFVIGPGVTAIVGPNGCGKSNLVEAFRWGMGETSARSIRADGMDDVIFGGTDTRPARASCEVSIFLDNSDRSAPAAFNDSDVIHVSRRLDRGEGSSYQVNGRKTRAKDVQILFQDVGAGAGSVALVSQGRVGSIISARPSERRAILEEAAGIAGLATRRHEAELRLRATEQNLEKAEDLERGLSEQLSSLRRQARQAARKRVIDDLVRSAEATAFLVRWRGAVDRERRTTAAHEENEARVTEAMLALRAAEAEVARIEEEVTPAIRARQEAETAHVLARARLESAEREMSQARHALNAARRAVERAKADLERERENAARLEDEILDLEDRKAMAEDDREHDGTAVEEAAARVLELEEDVEGLLATVEELAVRAAAAEADRKAADARRNEAARRVEAIEARLAEARKRLETDRARLAELGPPSDGVSVAEAAVAEAEARVEEAIANRLRATAADDAARQAHAEAQAELTALKAEMRGLMASAPATTGAAIGIEVSDGMETALAAALGEGLFAGLGHGEARWWEASPARISPPAGTRPLSEVVTVTEELAAAVSGIGIVTDEAEADRLASALRPGQAIVSKQGRLWRWDGYRTSGVGNAAEEVRRVARLRFLMAEAPRLEEEVASAARHHEECRKASEEARKIECSLTEAAKNARSKLEEVRRRKDREDLERNDLTSRIGANEAVIDAAVGELDLARRDLEDAVRATSTLPPASEIAEALGAARRSLEEKRSQLNFARAELDKVRRDAEMRGTMIDTLARSIDDARRRKSTAEALCAEMEARLEETSFEETRLAEAFETMPAAIEQARDEVEEASIRLLDAARAAADSEARLGEARLAVSRASEALNGLRENRARILAELKANREASEELTREIKERLGCEPDELPRLAGVELDAELPDLQACEARVARLVRERESIGMVNPLAEAQVKEMEARLGDALKARDELREAVSRLRRSIGEFDREARARLTETFALIDGHFRDLYTRMFGGGHAHLRLSGSDDILEAGLEIYACPPGKKLQTMSLLSGGEQALAALVLIFAAFLVRPAPVCVLDEVDAPLDDANVNRLCNLVAEMADGDATRFLVVTHHALTMARADRLYGVTMAERGVSRVTALDMDQAAAFVGNKTAAVGGSATA